MRAPGYLMVVLLVWLQFRGVFSVDPPVPATISEHVQLMKIFLQDITISEHPGITTSSSQVYQALEQKITDSLSDAGGYAEQLNIVDFGACVGIHLQWNNADSEASMRDAMKDLQDDGLEIMGQHTSVSFISCTSSMATSSRMMEFKFYVGGLEWNDNFQIESSDEYLFFSSVVKAAFSNLNGELLALEMKPNYACIEVYTMWKASNPTGFLIIMASLRTNGLAVVGQTYTVQSKPCQPPPDSFGQCLPPAPGSSGIGLQECGPQMPCQDGLTCCSNGFGHTCQRTNYVMRMKGKADLTVPWQTQFSDMNSVVYGELKSFIIKTISDSFGASVSAVDVYSLIPRFVKGRNMTQSSISVVVYFTTDLSNTDIRTGTFGVLKTPIMFATMKFRIFDFSLGDEGSCDGNHCEGLCKMLRGGSTYCSCPLGRRGVGCQYFDCRMDSANPSSNYCQMGAKCEKSDDDDDFEYKCDCGETNFGDTCSINICTFSSTANMCGAHGKCVGNYEEGQLCMCDSGWSGIFCNMNKPENLTKCEQQRRLMMFVQANLNGMDEPTDAMYISMKKLMRLMDLPQFPIPYCWSRTPSLPQSGQFYSICMYNSTNGEPTGMCMCTNSEGENNYYHYMGEGDCRAFTTNLEKREETMYIYNVTFTDDWKPGGEIYEEITEQVVTSMEPVGGYLVKLELFQSKANCVSMYVEWMAKNLQVFDFVIRQIVTHGIITVDEEEKKLSMQPCPVIVERLVNMELTVVVDYAYQSNFADKNGTMFTLIQSVLKTQLPPFIKQYGIKGFKQAVLLDIVPADSDTEANRRKRQTVQVNTKLLLKITFVNAVPVQTMMKLKTSLLSNGYQYKDQNFAVFEIELGRQGMCGAYDCGTENVCVEHTDRLVCACSNGMIARSCNGTAFENKTCNPSPCRNAGSCHSFGGESICSCLPDYEGKYCEIHKSENMNCNPNPCMNGGSCHFYDDDFYCKCAPQYEGKYCELNSSVELKVEIQLVVDYQYSDAFEDAGGDLYQLIKAAIEPAADTLMKEKMVKGYEYIYLAGISQYSGSVPDNMSRRKRQALSSTTASPIPGKLMLILKAVFEDAVPVNALMELKDDMLKTGFTAFGMNIAILHIQVGKPGLCGDMLCKNESICVEDKQNEYFCACGNDTTGTNCRGAIDQCDFLKPNACGEGKCANRLAENKVCICPPGKGGLFCDSSAGNASICEMAVELSSYMISVLNGSRPNDKFAYPIEKSYAMFTPLKLIVLPACRNGAFYSACLYSITSGQQIPGKCFCSYENGLPNDKKFYENGMCSGGESKSCDSNPCKNGASCHMDNSIPQCVCQPGYVGRFCETSMMNEKYEMEFRLTLATPFNSGYLDRTSSMYQYLQKSFMMALESMMKEEKINYFDIVIDAVSPSQANNATRRKRQTTTSLNTVITVLVTFNNSVPVEDVFNLKEQILRKGLKIMNRDVSVLEIDLGQPAFCGQQRCGDDSICVRNANGSNICVCDGGQTGAHCKGTRTGLPTCNPNPCRNGGTCRSIGSFNYCLCSNDFHGRVCESPSRIEDICEVGYPANTTAGGFKCSSSQMCPTGFKCHNDYCCFDPDFVCQFDLCESNSVCVPNFDDGMICKCPVGKKGLFCQEEDDGVRLTACQKKQRFNAWLARMLKTGNLPEGMDVQELQSILGNMALAIIPYMGMCNDEGQFNTNAMMIAVAAPQFTFLGCLDKFGDYDLTCSYSICEVMSSNVLTKCQNGGKCVGNVRRQLCDCYGTGHHGVLCEKSGALTMTGCQQGQQLAKFAMGMLNDSSNLFPGLNVPDLIRNVFRLLHSSAIFVPHCDNQGYFARKGCSYELADLSKKMCYCADEDGMPIGENMAMEEMPQNCEDFRNNSGQCPAAWGKNCVRPDSWCTNRTVCRGNQKCSKSMTCHRNGCSNVTVHCIDKRMEMPCDPKPCMNKPQQLCPVCGKMGKCFNFFKDNEHDSPQQNDKEDYIHGNNTEGLDLPRMYNMSMMKMKGGHNKGYYCQCPIGHVGEHCEVVEKVCATVPTTFCEDGCIGDIDKGILCRCDEGFSGFKCNKRVKTPCERRKALYDEALAVLRGEMEMEGYNTDELKQMIQTVVQMSGSDSIPELTCNAAGSYGKLKCDVNIYNLEKDCSCINYRGDIIASNVQPHIGYPPCTGPYNFSSATGVCSNEELAPICMNNGKCVFDLYNAILCECPDGYHGLYCERTGESEDPPASLCEYMKEAYMTVRAIVLRQDPWDADMIDVQKYIDLASELINSTSQESGKILLKPECTDHGLFKDHVCSYNVSNDMRKACYCWGVRGAFFGMQAASPEELNCTEFESRRDCGEMTECPQMKCEYGHRIDLQYCPTCECRNPCEGMVCGKMERCVMIETKNCSKESDRMCSRPKCMPIRKSGVCPGLSADSITSLLDPMHKDKNRADDDDNNDDDDDVTDKPDDGKGRCDMKCRDDSDCAGKMKCCGLCGSRCVEPEAFDNCEDRLEEMEKDLKFIREARKLVKQGNVSTMAQRMLHKYLDMHDFWLPSCEDKKYKPVQCKYPLENITDQGVMPSFCFCVDRRGEPIKGSKAMYGNDSSCSVKPFMCPHLQPDEKETDTCQEDLQCPGGEKCCSNGIRKLCASPVEKASSQASVEHYIDKICSVAPSVCEGVCNNTWKHNGQICECPANKMGPLCNVEITDDNKDKIPQTACERKQLVTRMVTRTTKRQTGEISPVLNAIGMVVRKELEKSDESKVPEMTVVDYNCTTEGDYPPMLCIRSLNSLVRTFCFCSDEYGNELLGTRKPYRQGLPNCGDRTKTCPAGHVLHRPDGSKMECGKMRKCPPGYKCTTGAFGKLHCCPNMNVPKEVCELPHDVGKICTDKDNMMPSVTMYYFDQNETLCKPFIFNGCGGNGNKFKTMQKCVTRCINKVHLGQCPSSPIRIAKQGNCKDKCQKDEDCLKDSDKCCASTCGMRCTRAIDKTPPQGKCPLGEKKPESKPCAANEECGEGFFCHSSGAAGVCCMDYNNVDICKAKPQNSVQCLRPDVQHFFNTTSKRCETFFGCPDLFNNFDSLEDCCETCSREKDCKAGECPEVKPGSLGICRTDCAVDGDCEGKQKCCSNNCGMVCRLPLMKNMTSCEKQLLEAKRAMNAKPDSTCQVMYMPRCDKSGYWSAQQCHSGLGVCWCVTQVGNYIQNTITRGVAICDDIPDNKILYADSHSLSAASENFKVCPNNQKEHCCSEVLCRQKCRAHPEAVCRINPCDGCNAEFYDADNNIVDCESDLSDCEKQFQEAVKHIQERHISAEMESDAMEKAEGKQNAEDGLSNVFNEWGEVIYDVPPQCQEPPNKGTCSVGLVRRWFYNPKTKTCNTFRWSMCGGNGNRFRTAEKCYSVCNDYANPCAVVRCKSNTVCTLKVPEDCDTKKKSCSPEPVCIESRNINLVKGIFVPKCLSSGNYNYRQCHGSYCWCVDKQGSYTDGLTKHGSQLECTASGKSDPDLSELQKCSDDSLPRLECMNACNGKVCPGAATARCQVDLCSPTCETTFLDSSGQPVKCEEDVCKVFSFDQNEQCEANILCDGNGVKTCPNSVCQNAKETLCKNPCALCMVDSCTCLPYFVDVKTGDRLSEDKCKYLTYGLCAVEECSKLREMEEAKLAGSLEINLPLPQCYASGTYKPKQCEGTDCKCVGENGEFKSNVDSDGDCKAIDEIKEIRAVLTFQGNFAQLKSRGMLEAIKQALIEHLVNLGIKRENIKVSDPFEGSVKMNVVIQENKDDAQAQGSNIGMAGTVLKQAITSGSINLEVNGETLPVVPDASEIETVTASKLSSEEEADKDSSGISNKEKIIIGAACGAVGLILLIVLFYCLCCARTKKEPVIDDTYDHIRETKAEQNIYDNPTMINNKAFDNDGLYMKAQHI